MPNGREVLNELEFEKLISGLNDRGLMEFNARQIYDLRLGQSDTKTTLVNNDKRLRILENRDKRDMGKAGGIGGLIGTAFGAAVVFIINHFNKIG